eukprot:73474-Prymnesium_polylepis.1
MRRGSAMRLRSAVRLRALMSRAMSAAGPGLSRPGLTPLSYLTDTPRCPPTAAARAGRSARATCCWRSTTSPPPTSRP